MGTLDPKIFLNIPTLFKLQKNKVVIEFFSCLVLCFPRFGTATSIVDACDTMSFSNKKKKSSAILPDGSLNLEFLERDISRDIASNNLYRAEDDMKKRAIHCSEFKQNSNEMISSCCIGPLVC